MKNLAICSILFFLGFLGQQHSGTGPIDAVWMLGVLFLVAYLGQQLARCLRLPDLVGWLSAGLLLGPSILGTVQPASVDMIQLVHLYTAIWLGCLTGARLPRLGLPVDWRLSGIIGLSTLAVFLLAFIALFFIIQLPWPLAFLLAAVSSFWGPFAGGTIAPRENIVEVGVIGNICSLVLLSAVLLLGWQPQGFNIQAIWLVIAFLGSPVLGFLTIECLWYLKIFERPQRAAIGLGIALLLVAVGIWQLGFYGLLCGVAAGLRLCRRGGEEETIQHTFNNIRPLVSLVFFSLLGANLDLRVLMKPAVGLYSIILVQIIILIIVRGIGPALWSRLPGHYRYDSGILLVKGALLFELVYLGSTSFVALPWPGSIELVQQILLGDILVHLLLFSVLAALAWRLRYGQAMDGQVSD